MADKQLQFFSDLKLLVLKKYQERFPYVDLNWKSFSSKDIEQLIEDVQTVTKERVSEKWIYTHLKPAVNEKLPRKDMLHIFALYCGFASWDAFCYENDAIDLPKRKNTYWYFFLFFAICLLVLMVFYLNQLPSKSGQIEKVQIKDAVTHQPIEDSTLNVYIQSAEKKVSVNKQSISHLSEKSELIVESPFYKNPKIEVQNDTPVIIVTSIDYALVLKAYLNADLSDWNTRKEKLDKILSEELEVMLYLPNQLGIEYMNKEEFSQKLIVPNSRVRKWEIIAITQDADEKITKIRIKH